MKTQDESLSSIDLSSREDILYVRLWRTDLTNKVEDRRTPPLSSGITSACLPDSDTRAVFPKGDIPGTDDVQRNFVEC
jgi:hypothetical protein